MATTKDLRYMTSMAAIKMVDSGGFLDLTEDDFAFLTGKNCWIGTERSRARRCIEASVYGSLDYLGLPRFAVPAEFVAGAIAYFVHPVNTQFAAHVMEGCEWSESITNGIEAPLKASEIFAHTLRVRSGWEQDIECKFQNITKGLKVS